MAKIDIKKDFKELYSAAKAAKLITVPAMNFVMIDGRGDPNGSPEFQRALETLYGLSYTIKFTLKRTKVGPEYAVGPLEGLWWGPQENMPADAAGIAKWLAAGRGQWQYTLMIVQPPHVTAEHVEQAKKDLAAKRPEAPVASARFEELDEGLCAQIMHVGPYSDEPPTIAALHRFIAQSGKKPRGRHHEIYLGDPRRTTPEKLKTILREPVE